MKKTSIEISFESEQLSALKQYMAKKELTIEAELEETLKKMYEKYVPQQVREYIESREEVVQVEKKVKSKSKQKELIGVPEAKIESSLQDEKLIESDRTLGNY